MSQHVIQKCNSCWSLEDGSPSGVVSVNNNKIMYCMCSIGQFYKRNNNK